MWLNLKNVGKVSLFAFGISCFGSSWERSYGRYLEVHIRHNQATLRKDPYLSRIMHLAQFARTSDALFTPFELVVPFLKEQELADLERYREAAKALLYHQYDLYRYALLYPREEAVRRKYTQLFQQASDLYGIATSICNQKLIDENARLLAETESLLARAAQGADDWYSGE